MKALGTIMMIPNAVQVRVHNHVDVSQLMLWVGRWLQIHTEEPRNNIMLTIYTETVRFHTHKGEGPGQITAWAQVAMMYDAKAKQDSEWVTYCYSL